LFQLQQLFFPPLETSSRVTPPPSEFSVSHYKLGSVVVDGPLEVCTKKKKNTSSSSSVDVF
jgi:hypothetical protein